MRVALILLLVLASMPAATLEAQSAGCQFRTGTSAAFCEDVTGSSPGGRAGELDDSKWSVGRVDGEYAPPNMMPFPSAPATSCKAGVSSVLPDNDVLVCDASSGHARQFETALAAQNYALLSLRPRQAFDFTGRTGTITYNVDAATHSPQGWWSSVYVTQDPVPGANNTSQVSGMTPRNGVGVNFDGNNCSGNLGTSVRVNNVFTYNDYAESSTPISNSVCIQTQAGKQNHIEIALSQTHIDVWASDFSTDGSATFPNFRLIGSANISLNFSQGYVHFQHAQRAPIKYFNLPGSTYYWSNLGFDGPVVGQEVGYGIPDALTPNGSKLNIGYGLRMNPNSMFICCPNTTVNAFTLSNVNTSVASARLTFSILYIAGNSSTYSVKYRFNNGTWRIASPAPEFAKALQCQAWGGATDCNWSMGFVLPVALSDLVQGTNTLQIGSDGSGNSYPPILANVELQTLGSGSPPPTSPTPTTTPTPTLAPTQTPQSTATPTVQPSATPSPTATPTQTCEVLVRLNGVEQWIMKPIDFCQ